MLTIPSFHSDSSLGIIPFEEFASLSLIDKTPAVDDYSVFERMEINELFGVVFGHTEKAKRVHQLVTEYLNYSSSPFNSSKRKQALMEACNSIICVSNQDKPVNAKACVILQTSIDENEAFDNFTFLSQLKALAKTEYVVYRLIDSSIKPLDMTIRDIAKELGGRPIMTLIVRGHPICGGAIIELGKGYYPTITPGEDIDAVADVKKEDFDSLHPKASIILQVGGATADRGGINGIDHVDGIARRIAAIQSRPVFSQTEDGFLSHTVLTLCCESHGYGMIGFDDETHQMSVKRLQKKDNGDVEEADPCLASSAGKEKIKEIILNNLIASAEAGDATEQLLLYQIYYDGAYVEQSHQKAFGWALKAAEQGLAEAQNNVGIAYHEGEGVCQSYKKAVEWFKKAAKQRQKDAQYGLGRIFFKGLGVSKSERTAVALFKKAAKQGQKDAQYSLGRIFFKGLGVSKSDRTAVELFQKAAKQGQKDARKWLAKHFSVKK